MKSGTKSFGPELVLASASPRRQDFLRNAGFRFRIHAPDVEELAYEDGDPAELVQENARRKGEAVRLACPAACVLAADTTVALGSRIFNKPRDRGEALRMLHELRGRTHTVFTAVTLVSPDGRIRSFVEASEVTFHNLPSEAIAHYVDTANPLDKAGAYGIQDPDNPLVHSFSGFLSNIIGLPIERTVEELASFGIHPVE